MFKELSLSLKMYNNNNNSYIALYPVNFLQARGAVHYQHQNPLDNHVHLFKKKRLQKYTQHMTMIHFTSARDVGGRPLTPMAYVLTSSPINLHNLRQKEATGKVIGPVWGWI